MALSKHWSVTRVFMRMPMTLHQLSRFESLSTWSDPTNGAHKQMIWEPLPASVSNYTESYYTSATHYTSREKEREKVTAPKLTLLLAKRSLLLCSNSPPPSRATMLLPNHLTALDVQWPIRFPHVILRMASCCWSFLFPRHRPSWMTSHVAKNINQKITAEYKWKSLKTIWRIKTHRTLKHIQAIDSNLHGRNQQRKWNKPSMGRTQQWTSRQRTSRK